MRRRWTLRCGATGLFVALVWTAAAQSNGPQTPADAIAERDLSDINWLDFKNVVPSRCETVLLPTGTLEPHGVINNGADIIAPVAMARAIAQRVNAMIAPAIPYGVTGSMDAFPGAFSISESAYRAYVSDVLRGLAKCGFRNIVIVNGHGGPQTAILNEVAQTVGRESRVRTLVINWWAYASDVTLAVFGEDGGHAGWNETAYVQAIDKSLVHADKFDPAMATPNAAPGTYSAYPAPSSIGLYRAGQGLPRFDQAKADEYFAKVNDKVADLIIDIREKWDRAGL